MFIHALVAGDFQKTKGGIDIHGKVPSRNDYTRISLDHYER
jgi:hypothetical protein